MKLSLKRVQKYDFEKNNVVNRFVSAGNKLFYESDSLKKQNTSVKISRNSIVLPNVSLYSEQIPLLSNAAVQQIDQAKIEQLTLSRKYRTHTKKKMNRNSTQLQTK